jgi:hypothetical protein
MTDLRLLNFQRALALPSGRILHSSGVIEESPSDARVPRPPTSTLILDRCRTIVNNTPSPRVYVILSFASASAGFFELAIVAGALFDSHGFEHRLVYYDWEFVVQGKCRGTG